MKRLIVILLSFTTLLSIAQNKKTIDLQKGSISEKFDELYNKSGRYKQYKVVEHQLLLQLKKQVGDSLQKQKSLLQSAKTEIESLQQQISQLQAELEQTRQNVSQLENQKDSITFLGSPVEKSKYKMIMWILLVILLLTLLYFIYAYKNAIVLTKEAKNNLTKLDEEYNTFRTNALEREQLLKRQLLDEQKKHQT
jgi:predicted PurR-regulated permease PerM